MFSKNAWISILLVVGSFAMIGGALMTITKQLDKKTKQQSVAPKVMLKNNASP